MKSPELHIVKIARALSDVSRVRIVREIAKCRGTTCGAAVKIAGLSQPTVSHHVKVLIDAGLLKMVKNGRHHIISVNRKALTEFMRLVAVTAER